MHGRLSPDQIRDITAIVQAEDAGKAGLKSLDYGALAAIIAGGGSAPREMEFLERVADGDPRWRGRVRRCYAAIKMLSSDRPRSAAVLFVMYGDRHPRYRYDLFGELAPVAPLTQTAYAAGGMQSLLTIKGEARKSVVARVKAECAELYAAAAEDYKVARRAVA